RRCDIDEVDGAGVEQAPYAVAGDLGLPGGDGDPRRLPDARHQRRVVVPVARLLEPADVEALDEAREAHGVVGGPAAVGGGRPDGCGAPGAGRGGAAGGQRRLASTARRKSGPAALRAASTRWASSSGVRPPTLNLQPAIPVWR